MTNSKRAIQKIASQVDKLIPVDPNVSTSFSVTVVYPGGSESITASQPFDLQDFGLKLAALAHRVQAALKGNDNADPVEDGLEDNP